MEKELRVKNKDLRIGKLKINAILLLICVFFLFTRLYQINTNPPSLYWDEASIGYNAYSVLQTGKDEWGDSFPIHFRAFGEFKLPVYIYSTVLTEAIFGLTPLGVRLPAILYGLGSLILIYFLTKKITGKDNAGLFAAFFFSISPWMFILTRAGYEASAGLFFFLLSIYFFLLSQQKKIFFLFFSASLIFSIYSYNSFRILSVLVFAAFLIYTLWTNRSKKIIFTCLLALILFVISFIPILRLYLLDSGLVRASILGLTPTPDVNNSSVFLKVSSNYISHYSPQFLFQGDTNPRSQQPGFGQIYLFDFILIFFGFIALLKLRKFFLGLIFFLLLIAPVPASLFKEAPHALRAILLAPIFAILSGLGIWWWIEKKRILLIPMLIILTIFFANYYLNFIANYPVKTSADWQYGYKVIYQQYADQFPNYDNIIISDDYAQPYIFSLVYLKIDPNEFQVNAIRNPINDWGFSTVSNFDKFRFIKENTADLNYPGKSLVFLTRPMGNRIPEKQINFLNGQAAFFVYTMEE